MKHPTSALGGFTLVEIMIVVAIIGLLASIAVPNYIKARERSYLTTCVANLHQIDGAIQSFAMEMKKDAGQAVTAGDIRPYLRTPPVCPAGGHSFEDSYLLTAVDAAPTCKRRPEAHKLEL